MAQQGKPGEIDSDMFRTTQDIAAQAALRAQERLQKVREMPAPGVPEVPARTNGLQQKAPDIPPKKASLKQASIQDASVSTFGGNSIPPPLPQKPQLKIPAQGNPNNHVYGQTTMLVNNFVNNPPRQSDHLPKVPARNSKENNSNMTFPLDNTNNSQLEPRSTKNGNDHLSPTEDTSSEDALRGIESGLRNMERAMQEQLNIRCLEASSEPGKDGSSGFNELEFRSGLRSITSLSSFEGLTPPQYIMDPYRKPHDKVISSGRQSLERGSSMEQMRLEHMAGQMRSLESNPNIRSTIEELKLMNSCNKQRPIEQHMRSLDRNLPLELQYSRNHRQHMQNQQQQQQLLLQQQLASKVMHMTDQNRHLEILSQFQNNRQNIIIPNAQNPGQISQQQSIGVRDDIKLRRRSSQDENQILLNTATAAGSGT